MLAEKELMPALGSWSESAKSGLCGVWLATIGAIIPAMRTAAVGTGLMRISVRELVDTTIIK